MHDGDPVLQAEQQLDQLARTDHLGDQVERHHDQRARGREDADRRLLEAEGRHVGEGELAQVAQPLGHQEGDDRPADQEADRVDQAVEAAGHHRGGDAQERGRRHVVAGDRQAVLEAGDAAAGGVEVGRALGLGRRPFGDEQRAHHEDARTCRWRSSWSPAWRPGRGRRRRRRPQRTRRTVRAASARGARSLIRQAVHFSTALVICVGQVVELAVGALDVERGDDDREHDDAESDRDARSSSRRRPCAATGTPC